MIGHVGECLSREAVPSKDAGSVPAPLGLLAPHTSAAFARLRFAASDPFSPAAAVPAPAPPRTHTPHTDGFPI